MHVAEAGEGTGDSILLLHGWPQNWWEWRHVIPLLAGDNRVLAPDLRGHGRSTGARPTYSFRQSALDAFALLDDLQITRVKVIGLSGGGITALHMAAMQPARVTAMITVSAPPRFPQQAQTIQRAFSETMLSEVERALMRERHQRPGQLDTLLAQVRAMPDGNDPTFSRGDLGAITADTLIVFGDRDFLYPVSLAFELHAAIPRSFLWVVPNGGHGPIFGPHAPAFVAMATAFLRGEWRTR
jgi:pimeloyl-ACP methyl ester carboxylesterase